MFFWPLWGLSQVCSCPAGAFLAPQFFFPAEDVQGFCLFDVVFILPCFIAAWVSFPLDEILSSLLLAPAACPAVEDLFHPVFFLPIYLNWIRAADLWVPGVAPKGFQEAYVKYQMYFHYGW